MDIADFCEKGRVLVVEDFDTVVTSMNTGL